MRPNRSMPQSRIIPELGYRDVREAADWLCRAFGFRIRLAIGDHRAQLTLGDGAVVVTALPEGAPGPSGHGVMVRVEDVDAHHAAAVAAGARITRPPTDYPYGERQYTAVDPGGHVWTFSQTLEDVAPEDWGGAPG